jgi:replication-associated recombination protein RarA
MRLTTNRGYDFFACSSAMQKAIRRNDVKHAGYFGMELFKSGYQEYVWKRLFIISAEDIATPITHEIKSLYFGYQKMTEKKKTGKNGGFIGAIFAAKAIILLCQSLKSRDADHLLMLVWDKKISIEDAQVDFLISDHDQKTYVELPDYTYDVHTIVGRRKGKTKEQFFKEEHDALEPKQQGLFDDLIK